MADDRYFDGETNEPNPAHLIYTDRASMRLEMLGIPVELPKGFVIHSAGEVPDSCYLIRRGRVMSYEFTASGEERIYNINEEGSLLFEPSVILGRPLTLHFKTMMRSILIRIPRDALLNAVMTDPEAAVDILCSVSEKFLESNEQIRESACHSVRWKVCNLLLSYALRFGVDYDGKVLIHERLSQQLMANLLRVNRVTVARVVRELRDLGLVEQVNGFYCIRSIQRMRKHMQYIDMDHESK